MRLTIFCLLSVLISFKTLLAQNVDRELQIDQQQLSVSLSFIPEKGIVSGEVEVVAIAVQNELDSIWFDGIKMEVEKIKLNDNPEAKFKVFDQGIAFFSDDPFSIGDTFTVNIVYEASPKRGMYFIGWDDPTERARKQIWTQGQGIDHRHWVPHVDDQRDKLITSVEVLFDSKYQVISNGKLISKDVKEGLTSWKFGMEKPHSSYLMMLAIGEYDYYSEQSLSGIELENYYYPDWIARNQYTYFKNSEIFNFMENEIGVDYPWINYKQVPVSDFQHGAMENTTATIFGDFYCVDSISFYDENYVSVNAHELAHQWFGNLVTADNSFSHWLHEGFATYYSWLAVSNVLGEDEMNKMRWQSYKNIAYAESIDDFPLQSDQAGSFRFYDKGAWLLYMLRNKMGDENYQASIKSYLSNYKYDVVSSEDFISICKENSDDDLDKFFKQWLFSSGIPVMNFKADFNQESGELKMTMSQEQKITFKNQPFYFTIPVRVKTNKDVYQMNYEIVSEIKRAQIVLRKGEYVEYIEVDPNFSQLIDWSYDMDEKWIYKYLDRGESDFLKARYIRSLEMIDYENFKSFIEGIEYASWPDYTQAEWMKKVARNLDEADKKQVKEWMLNTKPLAASVFLNSMDVIPKDYKKEVEEWLNMPSYTVKADALLKLGVSFKGNSEKFVELVGDYSGTRGNNVKINSFMIELLDENNAHVSDWIDMTGPSFEFMTRMNALDGLGLFGYYLNDQLTVNLFQALFQGNRRLSSKARNYLQQCYNKEDYQKTILAFINDMKATWEPWQKNRVNGALGIEIE